MATTISLSVGTLTSSQTFEDDAACIKILLRFADLAHVEAGNEQAQLDFVLQRIIDEVQARAYLHLHNELITGVQEAALSGTRLAASTAQGANDGP